MSDYTLIWYPEAVDEVRALSTRAATAVLNNISLLVSDPHPPLATVTSEDDGLYSMRVGNATVHYDIAGQTVRILMVTGGVALGR
ncbi:MAG TPA: hypothetical protein VKB59_18590 [Micromonosporaceae bacterium]|nr:hypothetical protein [Micromonosporaceae bacterium]